MAMIETTDLATRKDAMTSLFRKKQLITFGALAGSLLYSLYVFFAFDLPGLLSRASGDNARALIANTVSYKVHVTRDNRDGEVSVAIEDSRKGRYPKGRLRIGPRLGEKGMW